tara:strand:- start:506 stop:1099 length:594 start_codon:yes stop_codon:yes gene_type:complete
MAVYNAIKYNHDFSGNAGNLTLLSTFTSDGSDATASFTSLIDSTYEEYLFVLNSIHAETDDKHLTFQTSTNGGSSYGVTLTNTNFSSRHQENGGTGSIAYTDNDVVQGTGFAVIGEGFGNAAEESGSGILRLYNPSNTTFVKHYVSQISLMNFSSPPQAVNYYTAGYFNTTTAINAIQFKMNSGEIQGGTIQMFGVL